MEWEVFQKLIFVASSLGGTQCTIRRLQGENPHPWKILFKTSRTAMMTTIELTKSGPCEAPVIQWLRSALKPKM